MLLNILHPTLFPVSFICQSGFDSVTEAGIFVMQGGFSVVYESADCKISNYTSYIGLFPGLSQGRPSPLPSLSSGE